MKYLIVGLGNIGDEYRGTRHNIGFRILDAFAEASNISFSTERYGDVAHMRLKNKQLTLLKPSPTKLNGNDAGHNGLKNIAQMLGTPAYPRLRFGIGNDFPRGCQVDYVLGHFTLDQRQQLPARVDVACEAIKAFCLSGIDFAMCNFNNK